MFNCSCNYLQCTGAKWTISITNLCDGTGGEALGMQSGDILDSQITASSSYNIKSVGPQTARLEENNGAWCPLNQLSSENSGTEWIQVTLREPYVITAIVTQGKHDDKENI